MNTNIIVNLIPIYFVDYRATPENPGEDNEETGLWSIDRIKG
jgi:hypothetical protein